MTIVTMSLCGFALGRRQGDNPALVYVKCCDSHFCTWLLPHCKPHSYNDNW